MSFKVAVETELKKLVIRMERSEYTAWTKHDLKVVLRKYLRYIGRGDVIGWIMLAGEDWQAARRNTKRRDMRKIERRRVFELA